MKKLILALTILGAAFTAGAQITASSAFSTAPQKVFPLLDTNTRLDMIDYFNSGMSNTSLNNLEGQSSITDMSPESLSLKMTDSSTAQLVVLQGAKGPVVMLISTVAAPGLDSSISFFNDSWSPLKADDYFTRPDWPQWFTPAGNANEGEVMAQVPFMLASYSYDPTTLTLTVTNNLSRFLGKDLYDGISSYLYPSLQYVWNGKKFTLAK